LRARLGSVPRHLVRPMAAVLPARAIGEGERHRRLAACGTCRIVAAARYDPLAMRHTTFRFALAPTPVQQQALSRHAGASRFAYNQCLGFVTDGLAGKRFDPSIRVPWSGWDLVNAFNTWKASEAAGRLFVVAGDGTATKHATGLGWRREVCAQVFEEAAVDLGRALAAYKQAGAASSRGDRTGFPRRKRKGSCRDSFRLRNKSGQNSRCRIRVGEGHPRSVTLPTIGTVRVHDDTRRLRRLLRPVVHIDRATDERRVASRAKILFATVARNGDRWYVSLNALAPDLHPQRRHQSAASADRAGSVGVDRGLAVFAVAAATDGVEVGRFGAPSRCIGGSTACDVAPEPSHAAGGAPAIERRRRGGWRGSTPGSPTCAEVSSTRSLASSPRPTAGLLLRTSLLRTSSRASTLPGPSETPAGRSWPVSSATKPTGSVASW
jgi:hypothetical protein